MRPPRKATGTNTEISTSAIATTGPETSFIAALVASARRQLAAVHDLGDGFDHDDGIVHHQADREHQREQRQRIEREAERDEGAERADQGHRDRQHRDQSGAPALQEDEHHQQHQHARFEQGLDHFVHRFRHEQRGVEGYRVVNALAGRSAPARP